MAIEVYIIGDSNKVFTKGEIWFVEEELLQK